jgi:hypothetical protein
MTSPSTANTVPMSKLFGSKPRSFQRASAAVTPVVSSGLERVDDRPVLDHGRAGRLGA